MVARAAIRHCESIGDEVVAAAREDLDIADRDGVFAFFRERRPDAILNCAAFTDVDGAETNPEAAFNSNAVGVENLALAAREIDAAFLTISTDYVFDGQKSGFYTQRDTPNPISEYGRGKLAGEIAARNAYARSIVVRSGWIYGDGGTNFLSVMHRLLAEGKRLKAIHDAYGTPTFAEDLARRMRELVDLDMPCIFHVSNAGSGASYLEFAEMVCDVGRFDRNLIEPVSNKDLSRPAPRPVSSKLGCLFTERFGLEPLPRWEEALKVFVGRNSSAEARTHKGEISSPPG